MLYSLRFLSHLMPRIKLSRREWMLFLFPCSLLLLSHLDKFRALDASRLGMTLNPFARARENARSSSCQSNLKQIGLGFAQYQQDYDGHFPLNTTPLLNWVHTTQPYIKSCPILHCPSDFSPTKPMIPSYWMNANLNDKSGRGVSSQTVARPQRTFLLGEWDSALATSPFTLNEKSWSTKASYAERHLSGANYAFADGHVKWFSNDDIHATQSEAPCCTLHSWKLKVIK
jgi:prepilin-type processing-associated H-X9-DG protein